MSLWSSDSSEGDGSSARPPVGSAPIARMESDEDLLESSNCTIDDGRNASHWSDETPPATQPQQAACTSPAQSAAGDCSEESELAALPQAQLAVGDFSPGSESESNDEPAADGFDDAHMPTADWSIDAELNDTTGNTNWSSDEDDIAGPSTSNDGGSQTDLSQSAADRATMRRIEGLFLHFLENLVEQPRDKLTFADPVSSDNFGIPVCRRYIFKLASAARVLKDAHGLLSARQWATKRDLYYLGKQLYGKQWRLDAAVSDACSLLRTPRAALHITCTAKGLIYGCASWTVPGVGGEGESVDCRLLPVPIVASATAADGTAVPPSAYHFHETDAKFVLVVEKDASFQKLIEERVVDRLGPCVIVTGKGYPDIGTRSLLRPLLSATKLPAFALVDADPAGYEIFINYKYGPKVASHEARNLELPELQLLGVLRSEVDAKAIGSDQYLPLNAMEQQKVVKLKERRHIAHDIVLLRELDFLLATGTKLEIEALSGVRAGYLTDVYLRQRLQSIL